MEVSSFGIEEEYLLCYYALCDCIRKAISARRAIYFIYLRRNIMKNMKKVMSLMLVAAMSIALVACGSKTNTAVVEEAPAVVEDTAEVEAAEEAVVEDAEAVVEEVAEEVVEETAEEETAAPAEAIEVGEGATAFTFEVVEADGNTTVFTVNTDKKTVGEALLDNALVEGEDSEYGLYVKTVNGITADYDVDQTYWAFYVDGEYAMTGVDTTDVVAGSTYSFKVEK